ncbi:hypothetical protein ACJROX_25925 [Pseudalkalibacillus sp. A8]|uniref:hypothetical protein n=1 Tax=Pseudalkalibacillus sp. A8 TaxID=3382641 RepID=UPI0038B45A18
MNSNSKTLPFICYETLKLLFNTPQNINQKMIDQMNQMSHETLPSHETNPGSKMVFNETASTREDGMNKVFSSADQSEQQVFDFDQDHEVILSPKIMK